MVATAPLLTMAYERQMHGEAGALPRYGSYLNMPTVGASDPVADG
jgi:hypothetical protein